MKAAQKPTSSVSEIMSNIRKQVREEIGPEQVSTKVAYNSQTSLGELINSAELKYINDQHAFSKQILNPASKRAGPLGKVIGKFKSKLYSLVRSVLIEYLEQESQYRANAVRFNNKSARYIDDRFLELSSKIDDAVGAIEEKLRHVQDESSASILSSENRTKDNLSPFIAELRAEVQSIRENSLGFNQRIETVESVSSGLERILSRLSNESREVKTASESDEALEISDTSYVLLENRFRGDESLITERLKIYPEVFKDAPGKVLEMGAGRGELQELFKKAGVESYGVDLDKAMVEEASQKGLPVEHGDAIAHLRTLEDQSLGGLIAIQVVEHLNINQLRELCELANKKLAKGAKVVFETINPRSLTALSSNYFRDPTHVFPQHPDTLAFTMELSGLKTNEVRFLSDVPDEVKLTEIPLESYMTPRWAHTVELMNKNVRKLNELLWAEQDFCVIAEKC